MARAMPWAWLGLCWPCTYLVLGLRPWAELGWGFCRARVGLGGVMWWSVVGWECLACLPLFWPIQDAYGLVTLLPLLPCSLTYPGCPWPILWLPAGLSLATMGLSWAPLGLVPVLVPYLFSGLVPGLLLATLCLLLGLALGCPVLHLLYMGLRPVTCPVPGSCASGICTLILRYLYS